MPDANVPLAVAIAEAERPNAHMPRLELYPEEIETRR